MQNSVPSIETETMADHVIDGWVVVSYAQVVDRLASRYPERPRHEIEAIIDREADAFTGGRPLVVPLGVEDGAAEVLSRIPFA